MTQCKIDAGGVEINCKIGNKLEGKSLMFVQQIIRKGQNEVLML